MLSAAFTLMENNKNKVLDNPQTAISRMSFEINYLNN